jgi:hypothetical protein
VGAPVGAPVGPFIDFDLTGDYYFLIMPSRDFPGAEKAFREALTLPEPTTTLLELIKAHPISHSVDVLVQEYAKTVIANPMTISKLASVLFELVNSTDVPSIASWNAFGKPTQTEFAELLYFELYECHLRTLISTDKISPSVNPKNPHLTGSLISAASLKHRLSNCSTQTAVHDIIDIKNNEEIPAKAQEIIVLGSCLHLVSCGSVFYGRKSIHHPKKDLILPALEKVRKAGIVRRADGNKLLDVSL